MAAFAGTLAYCPFTCTVRLRPGIAGDASENGVVGRPVDIGRVIIVNQHLPFGAGQPADACSHGSGLVDMAFTSRLAIDVGTGIDRIGLVSTSWMVW